MHKKKVFLLLAVALCLLGCGQQSVEYNPMVENQQLNEVQEAEESKEKNSEEIIEEPEEIIEEPEEYNMSTLELNKDFYTLEFDENSDIFARIKGKSYKDNCTVPVSDLRYLHVLHYGFDGQIHEGEIICNKYIIFRIFGFE